MDLHLLSDVRNDQGDRLGELRHIVMDPSLRRVEALVVQESGLDGHAVIHPIGAVDGADDDAVYSRLSPDEFAGLTPYGYSRNIAPPPPDSVPEEETEEYDQTPDEAHLTSPIGAASGISTIAFTPIIDVVRNVPDYMLILDDGTRVVAVDGDVGSLDHLLVDDESKVLQSILVNEGGLTARVVEVQDGAIEYLSSEEIRLSIPRSEVSTSDEG